MIQLKQAVERTVLLQEIATFRTSSSLEENCEGQVSVDYSPSSPSLRKRPPIRQYEEFRKVDAFFGPLLLSDRPSQESSNPSFARRRDKPRVKLLGEGRPARGRERIYAVSPGTERKSTRPRRASKLQFK